jgi:FtsP/CotA-like multicopper oxidase with cupredoxin domain
MDPRNRTFTVSIAALTMFAALAAAPARAEIPGVTGTSFTLTARADRISTPDGGSFLIWGFASAADGRAQYPGPTLIVNQGTPVTISVTNALANTGQSVSLAFPGQADDPLTTLVNEGVVAACSTMPCVQGPVTMEAGVGGTVTYTFTASRPGTFVYNSATRPDLQVEMGLFGALIVRPSSPPTCSPTVAAGGGAAYGTPASCYDQEYLFLLSEIDSRIHDIVDLEGVAALDASGLLSNPFPNYWFMNGRNAPDTMAEPNLGRLPTQPYNALPRTHPGDRVLMRVIGGGRELHPFHHHGNHARVIAVDGFLKQSGPGDTLDLSHEVFTIQSLPGQTVDAIFDWTGKDLGWDIYGDPSDPAHAHTCGPTVDARGLDTTTKEYCGDHGKLIPVTLPDQLSLTFGGFWSGSPYLGTLALLPPGQGGLNPNAGFTYMWHSHTEKELTNYDVFPGGMMTMLIIEPMGVSIP